MFKILLVMTGGHSQLSDIPFSKSVRNFWLVLLAVFATCYLLVPEDPGYLIVCAEDLLKFVTGPLWPLVRFFM